MVLCEDDRTRRFVRQLLRASGFDVRRFRLDAAPRGEGSGEAWVRARYPPEVRVLRSNNFQRGLAFIAVRDGDSVGVSARKADLDDALSECELPARGKDEPIATPVPTWSIETWLLDLLGQEVDERRSAPDGTPWKRVFERAHADGESDAIARAVEGWLTGSGRSPSLLDGRAELARLDR